METSQIASIFRSDAPETAAMLAKKRGRKNFMKKRTLFGLGLAGLTAMFSVNARAGMLLNEAFDEYTNGTALTATGNWTAASGAGVLPITATGGTVTATNLASGTSGEDDKNVFSTAGVTTGTVYFSFLVTAPTSDSTLTSTTGDYFLSGTSTSNAFLGRVFLSKTATGVAFGLSSGASTPSTFSSDITLGTEYKLVMRIDLTAKTSTLGVFSPATTSIADTDLTLTGGAAGTATNIASILIRQGSATGSAFTTVIDGVQAGTTLADVSGIATGASPYFNVVPEPSAYATFAVGLLALIGVQRARRRAV